MGDMGTHQRRDPGEDHYHNFIIAHGDSSFWSIPAVSESHSRVAATDR